MEKFEEEKIENIKRATRPVDGMPLISTMIENSDGISKEQRKEIGESIVRSANKVGNMLLERCFIEGDMTEEEYKEISEKYNLQPIDYSSFLQGYFNRKDGLLPLKDKDKDKDKVMVVTTPDSRIFKCRDFIKERFDIGIITAEEGIQMMEKMDKNKDKVKVITTGDLN